MRLIGAVHKYLRLDNIYIRRYSSVPKEIDTHIDKRIYIETTSIEKDIKTSIDKWCASQ